jgi:hypothetical protein
MHELNELSEIEVEALEDEESSVLQIPEDKRRIHTGQADPEIDSLHGKYKRGKLVLQPDFQRQFVWDAKKSSRLIESALLSIPLPVIYLSEEPDNREHVIDGQQRLTSFFAFLDGKLPNGRDFRLQGLQVFPEHEGKLFRELPDEVQDKIRYYKIRTVTLHKESDADLKFEVFERLNTGSVSLNDQELRNCIFRGPYNALLKDLSRDPDFCHLLGLSGPDKRMKDVELVLRFAAFNHATYLNYKPPMKRFLNEDMKRYQNLSDADAQALRQGFKNAVQIIRSLLDRNAFKRFYKGDSRNPNGRWEPKKFNASLYDILMYSFAREDKNTVFRNLDAVREALIYLMTSDQEFIDSIELSTSSLQAVTTRFDKWRLTLRDILGVGHKEPRCFSGQLKQELFQADSTCAICGQQIQAIDDAAVDHIRQYWTGGATIPENARLTHRYCNWSRSRNDGAVPALAPGD